MYRLQLLCNASKASFKVGTLLPFTIVTSAFVWNYYRARCANCQKSVYIFATRDIKCRILWYPQGIVSFCEINLFFIINALNIFRIELRSYEYHAKYNTKRARYFKLYLICNYLIRYVKIAWRNERSFGILYWKQYYARSPSVIFQLSHSPQIDRCPNVIMGKDLVWRKYIFYFYYGFAGQHCLQTPAHFPAWLRCNEMHRSLRV